MVARATRLRLAFCLGASFISVASTSARADVVTDWNQTALRATEIAGVPVPVQTRAMAMVHAAVFDAVNAVGRKYTFYAIDSGATQRVSPEAAAAAAAHAMLQQLFPLQKAITDAALASSLARLADGEQKAEGLRLGTEIAEKLFQLRKDDGSGVQASYSFGTGAGVYQATPPMNANPVLPHWRNVKPFAVTSAKQFAFAGPPPLTSALFAKDVEEVKRLGARTSAERTGEQTALAIHWAGSEVPPLNAVARAASAVNGLSLLDNARLFALLNIAMADALIAGFDAKYQFNFWRPVTAIRSSAAAGSADSGRVSADLGWEPLLVTPPHPEYPSAHCLGAGAAVTVLQDVFGGDKASASYVYPPLGVMRQWSSFSQIAAEIEDARIWGGIHYRTAVEHGTQVGSQVAQFILKTKMRPATD